MRNLKEKSEQKNISIYKLIYVYVMQLHSSLLTLLANKDKNE